MSFKFIIGQKVQITRSGELGIIEGRAEYDDYPNCYLLKYTAADGRAAEDWFKEKELSQVSD